MESGHRILRFYALRNALGYCTHDANTTLEQMEDILYRRIVGILATLICYNYKKGIDNMKYLFICYKSCSTCAKAKKTLETNNLDYTYREITTQNPTVEELKEWVKLSGLPIKKFFNTSGKIYREKKLKEKLKYMTDLEKLQLLATDGMLVKRPLLIAEEKVLVGFDEEEYQKLT